MARRAAIWLFLGGIMLAAALIFAPGPISPVAWEPPEDAGLTGPFTPNDALSEAQEISMDDYTGPEDIAAAPDGALYISTHEGAVLRQDLKGAISVAFETGGRPLGVAVAPNGDVYVADAYRGLLRWSGDAVEILIDAIDGEALRYANSVAISTDGVVYFTQSTRRFDPEAAGSTLAASVLDIAEHRRTGRLMAWRSDTGEVEIVSTGFSFANGVALSADESYAVVVETGSYRIWRVELAGEERGEKTPLLGNLPGFPDNVKRSAEGDVFWIGIGSLRRPIADFAATTPGLRSVLFKLPNVFRPGPKRHGIVFAMDATGAIRAVLQDQSGEKGLVSGALPVGDALYITMLEGGFLYKIETPTLAPPQHSE